MILADYDLFGDEGKDYVTYHSRRFLDSYNQCVKYLKKGDKVLSIGAAFGSLELALQKFGAEVTVVDFPDVIAVYKDIYDRHGLKTISADLSKDELDLPADYYDMLLESEVIEHLPVAPSEQFAKFRKYIKKGGLFVVTTPNLGSILHVMKVLFMKPLFDEPEKFFGPINTENLGVHRREYIPSEIHQGFETAGFSNIHTSFFHYTYPKSMALRILYGIGSVIPRFMPGMLLIGKKK